LGRTCNVKYSGSGRLYNSELLSLTINTRLASGVAIPRNMVESERGKVDKDAIVVELYALAAAGKRKRWIEPEGLVFKSFVNLYSSSRTSFRISWMRLLHSHAVSRTRIPPYLPPSCSYALRMKSCFGLISGTMFHNRLLIILCFRESLAYL